MNNIYILGKPCAGKTSIAHKLQVEFGIAHLKVGQLVKQHIIDQYGEDSDKMDSFNQGNLIDIREVSAIVHNKVQQYTNNQNCALIDGFPRSIEQYNSYQIYLNKTDIFLVLLVSDENVLQRSQLRLECSKCTLIQTKENKVCIDCGEHLITRSDEASIKERLEIFNNLTLPAIELMGKTYALHYIDVNTNDQDVIFDQIKKNLNK